MARTASSDRMFSEPPCCLLHQLTDSFFTLRLERPFPIRLHFPIKEDPWSVSSVCSLAVSAILNFSPLLFETVLCSRLKTPTRRVRPWRFDTTFDDTLRKGLFLRSCRPGAVDRENREQQCHSNILHENTSIVCPQTNVSLDLIVSASVLGFRARFGPPQFPIESFTRGREDVRANHRFPDARSVPPCTYRLGIERSSHMRNRSHLPASTAREISSWKHVTSRITFGPVCQLQLLDRLPGRKQSLCRSSGFPALSLHA